jgi:hypothetical protein
MPTLPDLFDLVDDAPAGDGTAHQEICSSASERDDTLDGTSPSESWA